MTQPDIDPARSNPQISGGGRPFPRLARAWDVAVLYVLPPVLVVGLGVSLYLQWPGPGPVNLTERYALQKADRIVLRRIKDPDRRLELKDRGLISLLVEDLRLPKLPGTACDCEPIATAEFYAGGEPLLKLGSNNKYYWYDGVQYQWPKPYRRLFPKLFSGPAGPSAATTRATGVNR